MSEEMIQGHATISKAGEVDFPLWVKALAWLVGVMIPLAILGAGWVGNVLWDMSERMTRMESKLEAAADDRYRASEATAAHALLQLQIERHEDRLEQIEDRLGMRALDRRRANVSPPQPE